MNLAIEIRVATEQDLEYINKISRWYELSSAERGTGIAKRKPEYLKEKILKGNAIIAFVKETLAGFCYIETFSAENYVSNSGLIVSKHFRGRGIAKKIKKMAFNHARNKYPKAKVFGITTSDIVMKINSELGYIPVSFSKLTSDDDFWQGCSSCSNFDILMRNNKKMCLCTAMLAPSKAETTEFDADQLILQPNKNKSDNEQV